MQLGSPELRAWLSKHFKGHPIDLVVLVFYRLVGGVSQIGTGAAILLFGKAFGSSHLPAGISGGARGVGLFLLAYGTLKLLTAAALWSRSNVARAFGLLFFCSVVAYSGFRLTSGIQATFVVVLIVNLFFAWYFWKIMPKYILAKGEVVAEPAE